MPYYFSAGLVAYGPLDIRPQDFVVLGLAYGSYSDQLRPAKLYDATLVIGQTVIFPVQPIVSLVVVRFTVAALLALAALALCSLT
jgi:hypothetical protein